MHLSPFVNDLTWFVLLIQIQAMIDGLKAATKDLDLSLQEADEIQPLPPASSQRFLMERKDIPVIVITDHQNEFTNKWVPTVHIESFGNDLLEPSLLN